MSKKIKRLRGYSTWFYWTLLLTCTLVSVSGVLMIPVILEFKLDLSFFWHMSNSLRLPVVALHVISSWFLLMMLGALWQSHMKAGWQKVNWRSGLLSTVCICLLTLSGAGLYYLGSEAGQLSASLIHTFVGLLLILSLGWHVWHGHRIRAAKLLDVPIRTIDFEFNKPESLH